MIEAFMNPAEKPKAQESAAERIAELERQLAEAQNKIAILQERDTTREQLLAEERREKAELREERAADKERIAKLEDLATKDTLTGLNNRQGFNEAMDHMEAEAQREGKQPEYTLITIDLNGFKGINDSLGHPGGDEALKLVAKRLRLSTREVDTVARFGGDEFAVILSHTEGQDADVVANRILTAIRDGVGNDMRNKYGEKFTGIAASIGVCATEHVAKRQSEESSDSDTAGKNLREVMLETADELLYKAKALKIAAAQKAGQNPSLFAGNGNIVSLYQILQGPPKPAQEEVGHTQTEIA